MKVLLIRHTEQEYPLNAEGKQLVAVRGTPLSKFGEEQAQKLGETLAAKRIKPKSLFMSPHLRTDQTARILQRELIQ